MATIRFGAVALLAFTLVAFAGGQEKRPDGNRLAHLDTVDPYYPSARFAKLTTPQWLGEPGVEAVVILGIDDMRDHEKYEAFLRPILGRLKEVEGRAPLSIMTNRIDPKLAHLQGWLKEGVSLETHTYDHPCPLLQGGDFAKARTTYEKCVDLLSEVPNSKPVAFRMPCCDSLNTPSPRFYAEIFNQTTPGKNFLTIDTSVFNIFTSKDPELPRELTIDPEGRERFLKYVPAGRSFVNTIENYPYPYVIGGLCWQFPCVTPSDWQANFFHKPNNPVTVRDLQAALDCTVIKQGVFCLVFHPHGWIRSEQVVELIDHAVKKHGKKVKFLSFKDAQERLDKHLLAGQPVRDPKTGGDNGVRLLDVNNDGYQDVVIGNAQAKKTRVWQPKESKWQETSFPRPVLENGKTVLRFGIVQGAVVALAEGDELHGWRWHANAWQADDDLVAGLNLKVNFRLRDVDGDGSDELLSGVHVFTWAGKGWQRVPFSLPMPTVSADGLDNGVRYVDVDEDGRDDVVFSNHYSFGVHLFSSMKAGWSRKVLSGRAGAANALPLIATRTGENLGFWAHSQHLWWQNEHTALLANLVDRRSFKQLLEGELPGPKSPEASLKTIKVRDGFTVELMAAEPLVMDPVAFAWGPDGKFWVVEMGDYPRGIDDKGKHGGIVRFLEDTNGDGKYDKSTIFLEGLGFPTGVMPWKKGVLITCAPDILYAEDTDGDGKADKKEVVFTGFRAGNQQHRVNSLVWGLDNWIYGANGDSGGVIEVRDGKPVNISGRDFRFRPDERQFDLQAGQTQFGRCRDDWGNWFGGNNSNPLWHYALEDHYLRRNPHLPAPDARVQVPVVPGAATVNPTSRTLARFNNPQSVNHFTSACSPVIYRDDLFGPAYAGNSFVSEPVHNLVHREVVSPKGITFTSQRADDEKESEFLASSDNWFRPTTIAVGPDGALWVADMYRLVIEHPEWIPKDWQDRLDLRAGHDLGRIYRIYPSNVKPRALPRLDKLDTAGLVAALDSPSGWQRDLAQQLLLWRNDKAAVPLLQKQAADSTRAQTRLHALCTLDGLVALDAACLKRGLIDDHAGVRRHAVRLAEAKLGDHPVLGEDLLKLADDPDPLVRLQLAYTLGAWKDARAGQALGQLALRDGGDRFVLAAIFSSVNRDNLDQVLAAVLKTPKPPASVVESLLRLANATGNTKALVTLLNTVAAPQGDKSGAAQFATLAGLLDALDQRGTPLTKLHAAGDAELRQALDKLNGLFASARKVLADESAPAGDRLAAARLVGRGLSQRDEDVKLLAGLLVPQTPDDLQAACMVALGQASATPALLLERWKGFGPARRGQVLDIFLARNDWTEAVLAAIENKQIAASEIGATHRQRLLEHKASAIRTRAGKLLAGSIDSNRQKVVDAYQPVVAMTGEVRRGMQVFAKTCATCHKLGDVGKIVGADLTALGDKSPQGLLVAILDPNRAVEARYINYTAVTKNGLSLTGVLAAESGNSVTLLAPDGKEHVILRSDLEELVSSGRSVMPEGLEKELPPEAMADLIAYIRSVGPAVKPKQVAGNRPALVTADDKGTLLLTAINAEIHGKTLTFEDKHQNLGYWTSEDDRAAWEVNVSRAGRYEVWLDWACPDTSAGKPFVLEAGGQRFTGKVEATKGWDDFRQERVGALVLTAGKQRITLNHGRTLNGSALLDLRSVKLVLVGPE